MAQNAPEIAAKSVDILLKRIDDVDGGRPTQADKVILEATLVMRDSA